jgi:DsbC/DsbD-like thiol-disulfide interchange protein
MQSLAILCAVLTLHGVGSNASLTQRANTHDPGQFPSERNEEPTKGPTVQVEAMPLHWRVAPGGSTTIAVRLQCPNDWHVYWSNPGASGSATELTVKAPLGLSVGPVAYSRPTVIAESSGDVIGYAGLAVLLVPVSVDKQDAPHGWVDISIEVDWLVCKGVCFLGSKTLQVRLLIAPGEPLTTVVSEWVNSVSMPQPLSKREHTTSTLHADRLVISGPLGPLGPLAGPNFMPIHVPGVELGSVALRTHRGQFQLTVPYYLQEGDSLGFKPRIKGLLTIGNSPKDPCWAIDTPVPAPPTPTQGANQ